MPAAQWETDAGAQIDPGNLRSNSGVYQLTAIGETSWHGYVSFIVDRPCAMNELVKVGGSGMIATAPSNTYPGPPHRSISSELSGRKLTTTFGMTMPAWQTDIAACLHDSFRKYGLLNKASN